MSILVQVGIVPVLDQIAFPMAAAAETSDAAALKMPKRKEDICKLRWEIKHKVTKKQRRPLTKAEINNKQAQIEAYEKLRVADGGKPLRALNKKIEAIPQKTADAVVARLTSVENSPGLSKEEQIEEDLLKMRVIQSRVNRNRGLVAKEKFEEKLTMLTDGDRERLAKRFDALLQKKEDREDEIQKKRKEAEEKKAVPKRKRKAEVDPDASTMAPSESAPSEASESSSVVGSEEGSEAGDPSRKRRRWRMLPWLEAVAAPEVKEETLSEEEEEEPEEEEVEGPEHLAPVQEAPAQEAAPAQETPVEERPFKLTLQYLEEHENAMEALKKAYDAFEVEVLDPAIEAYNEAEANVKIASQAEKTLAKENLKVKQQEMEAVCARQRELGCQIQAKSREFYRLYRECST